MSRRVVVTGATGFAGGHLLDLLAKDDVDMWAFHRGTDRHLTGAARGSRSVTWSAVDLLDRNTLNARVADIRPAAVYHCAGAAHVASSWTDRVTPLEVNVLGTHYLLDALRLAGLKSRVLIPSSAMVYRPSNQPIDEEHVVAATSPYGFSKLAQEMLGGQAAAEDEQPVLIARAFNHLGPGQDPSFAASSFARQIARIEAGLEPPEIEVGNLDARRDITDVRDTVRAYRMIMERGVPGRPYNVCSGVAPSMGELLERLIALARVPVAVRQDPARLRPADNPLLVGNRERLERELGWRPLVPLDDTLRDLLEYWRVRTAGGETVGSLL